MPTRQRNLPDSDAIRERISAVEGHSTTVEVLTHGQYKPSGIRQHCALVRSTESRRVYLLIHEENQTTGWQPPWEIIGFDGLRAQMRMRQAGPKRRQHPARTVRKRA